MRKTILHRAIAQLEKRIARLEQVRTRPWLPGLLWLEPLEDSEREAMTANDRVVHDVYQDREDQVRLVRERVTCEPRDVGRVFRHQEWECNLLPPTGDPPIGLMLKTYGPDSSSRGLHYEVVVLREGKRNDD